MSLAEFEDRAAALQCRDCRETGGLVVSAPHPANNGIRPVCTRCGSVAPLADVLWLSRRRPYIGRAAREALEEFLARRGAA